MSDINLDTLINLVKLAKEKDITLVAVSKTKKPPNNSKVLRPTMPTQ